MSTKFTAYNCEDGIFYLHPHNSQHTLIFEEGAGCPHSAITEEMANLVVLYRKQIPRKQHAPTFMEELGNALKAFIQFEAQ